MNKKGLISRTAEFLRQNNIKKEIPAQKTVFHVSDDDGNQKDFIIRKTGREIIYTVDDVSAILEALLAVTQDSIRTGEEVSLHGFGTLGLNYRAARATKRPDTGEWVDIEGRYVPKFVYGKDLRTAARVYEKSLQEAIHRVDLLPPVEGGDQ